MTLLPLPGQGKPLVHSVDLYGPMEHVEKPLQIPLHKVVFS